MVNARTLPRALAPALAALLLAGASPPPALPDTGERSYVELVDMARAAPLVLEATVTRATPLKDQPAPAGKMRYLIEAQVTALVSGRADVPPQISFLADLPAEPRKLKLKGAPVLLLAQTTATPGELRLIGPRALLPQTPDVERRVRGVLTALLARDAPPGITGVARAFHVTGALPGESETQIFLKTADARPISLNVLRRPGEQPRWAVALSEMVDDSAAPPKPETLLWYRLACGLPARLPDAALDGQSDSDAAAARADYQVVRDGLGPCTHAAPVDSPAASASPTG